MTKTASMFPATPASDGADLPPSQATELGSPPPAAAVAARQAPASLSPSQATETAFEATKSIAGFLVFEALGQGGMATVYRAQAPSGEAVALKLVREDGRRDQAFVDRFLREVRAARKLEHPNVCRVLDGGRAGDDVFMAIELLSGGDVDGLARRVSGGRLPPEVVGIVIGGVLRALAHAHERGVVHRDIKPANVMLAGTGPDDTRVKLVDFGIARVSDELKLTATGLVVGTPAYMSPEQARGQTVDARSDLFSVGVMLVELATGTHPFLGENTTQTVLKILSEPVAPLVTLDRTIPGVLSEVAGRLLEKRPEDRYQSAAEALADLEPWLAVVSATHTDLLSRMADDAVACARLLAGERVTLERQRLASLEARLPESASALVLALHRLALIEQSADADAACAAAAAAHAFVIGANDERLAQALLEAKRQPSSAAVLRRVVDLARAARDPVAHIDALCRYLQVRPDDELARRQYVVAAFGPAAGGEPGEQRRHIQDGLKTSGFVQARRTAVAHRRETGPAQPAPATPSAAMMTATKATPAAPRSFGVQGEQSAPLSFVAADPQQAPWRLVAVAVAAAAAAVAVVALAAATKTSAESVKTSLTTTARVETGAIDRGLGLAHDEALRRARQASAQHDWQGVFRETTGVVEGDPDKAHLVDALALRAKALRALRRPKEALIDVERFQTHAGPSHQSWYDIESLRQSLQAP